MPVAVARHASAPSILRQPLLQHRNRRVAEARILIVAHTAGEGGLRLRSIVIDETAGQVERFRRLPKGRPACAAMHEQCCGSVGRLRHGPASFTGRRRQGDHARSPQASLARFFHLAAIRPDKSRGDHRRSTTTVRPGICTVNRNSLYRASARRGCSSMVERQLPKLHTRVRFPSPAPVCSPGDPCQATALRSCGHSGSGPGLRLARNRKRRDADCGQSRVKPSRPDVQRDAR